MEPSEKGVTMEDVDEFAAAFRAVPEESREDGIRRALNLVPDENALLLAGVLMDKSQPHEFVELVFNDVLNRAEEVKLPILRQILKDAGAFNDSRAIAKLEKLGFRLISGKKHWKLEYAGIRFPLAKTPSDFRAHLNTATDVANRRL